MQLGICHSYNFANFDLSVHVIDIIASVTSNQAIDLFEIVITPPNTVPKSQY